MSVIDCPRAKSDMTPCIARDGALALADDGVCVGCGARPSVLLRDLAERYEPARADVGSHGRPAADRLRDHVAAYVEA